MRLRLVDEAAHGNSGGGGSSIPLFPPERHGLMASLEMLDAASSSSGCGSISDPAFEGRSLDLRGA